MSHANNTSKIWHEIFFHLNFKYLQQLHNDKMVEGFPSIQTFDGVCGCCLVGKHPEKKYDVGKAHRYAYILDLIHSDVAGPIPQTPSMAAGISSPLLMIVLGTAGSTS